MKKMKYISNYVMGLVLLALMALLPIGLLQGCDGPLLSDTTPFAQQVTQPELRLVDKTNDGRYDAIELVGLNPEILSMLSQQNHDVDALSELLAIYTITEQGTTQTSPVQTVSSRLLVGKLLVDNERLRLYPRYPFDPNVTYIARANLAVLNTLLGEQTELSTLSNMALLELTFSEPAVPSTSNTTVTDVYPSADILPENLLRFYIHFSSPMRSGDAYDHIRVLDSNGDVVERPFLAIGRELWNPAKTRLTVMLDPGRIKRNMAPNQQAGLPLVSGESYRLVIDSEWEDASGHPLSEAYQKSFRVGQADFDSPQVTDWQLVEPAIDTAESLTVHFPEPMDHALLQRMLTVQYLDGTQQDAPTSIPGVVSVGDGEQTWQFTPDTPWQQGRYQLVINTLLEDIAGNSLRRPFDTDVNAVKQHSMDKVIELAFHIQQ
ncbi:MAG: hypothetical protein AAF639_46485 [Chloroflexota bacterium]